MQPQAPTMRKAVVFTVNREWLGYALFAARRILELASPRDFDVIIASLDPLPIPDDLAALGIRNDMLDLGAEMAAENLQLRWLPNVAYLRLWLPIHYRERYDRLLYLDADTYLCSPDLSRLFEVNLGAHALAAALDKEHFWQGEKPIIDFETLGMETNRYFNSGVLLIDTDAYTEQGFLKTMLDINRSDVSLAYHDQSLLNVAAKGAFAELSPRWNWQFPHRFPVYTHLAHPCLLHFSNNPRPWQGYEAETRFTHEIIAKYADFLSRFEGTDAPPRNQRPLREPIIHRIDNLLGHVQYLPLYRRYMSRHKTLFETRL